MLSTTCIFILSLIVVFTNANKTESCVHLYEKGVESYLDNKFGDCVRFFENALQNYRDYSRKLQNCRLQCRREADLSEPLYPVDIDDLLFYEKAIKTTACIIKCKKKHFEIFGEFNINRETEILFQDRKPYEYLHLCYYQEKQFQKAASAVFTYLIEHPEDKIMLATLKQYSKLDHVNMNEIINFEAKDYVYLYIHGSDAYDKKDWKGVEDNMEESLSSYLQAEEECRVQCEGPFDQGWFPDFVPSIANHFTYCLRCKHNCQDKLNSLNGERHEDLLPSHYHYLQFAHFKLGNLKAACEAVASYMLFYPNDETMLQNMRYYSSLPKVTNDFFKPRPEAIRYVQRHTYEKKLIKFIAKEFQNETLTTENNEVAQTQYTVTMSEDDLKGPKRFVADGIISQKECRTLLDVAKMFAILGDGYQGKTSPHTLMEKFEGVTMGRASLLVYFGLLDFKFLELYLKITENAKQKVVEYFNLEKELYFTYTHLVCRSALPDSPKNRTDFSHAIHADNCNIRKDGICERAVPAYTWRDYSAIIYLNENFEGGDFIFSSDPLAQKIQSTVAPKCGRMIAFSSGPENLHGVKAVKKGSRCAVGIWFTFSPGYNETDRELAYKLLNDG